MVGLLVESDLVGQRIVGPILNKNILQIAVHSLTVCHNVQHVPAVGCISPLP